MKCPPKVRQKYVIKRPEGSGICVEQVSGPLALA